MALFQDSKEDVSGNHFVNLNDSAGTGLTSTNVTGKQGLDVNIINSISTGVADKTTFTYGSSTETPVGGVFQDTSPTLTAGQGGVVRLTGNRAFHVNLRNASGVEIGVSGSAVIVDGSAVTQPISAASLPLPTGASTEATLAALKALCVPATGTLTQLVLTTASQTALASNASRKGAVFVNDSNKRVWLAFTATATTAAYTVKLQPNSVYEMADHRVYTGVISAISETGISGNLVVTELS